MKPSRTRLERQTPSNPYLSEMELKQALEIQAAERKKALHLIELQEKAELLKHYENYAIGKQQSSDEDLYKFIEKKREEFDGMDEDLYQAQELLNKKHETFLKKPKKSPPELCDYENVNNFVQIEEEKEYPLSQGELERQKRLKLRDEERLRRLHGIKNSAYDSENGKMSFGQQQELKHYQLNEEKPKNQNLYSNNNNNIKNNINDIYQSKNEKTSQTPSNKDNLIKTELYKSVEKSTKNSDVYERKNTYPEQNTQSNNNNNIYNNFNNNVQDENKVLKSENLQKLASKEKQMKYKDELDQQIALKQKEKEELKKPRAVSANMEGFQPHFQPWQKQYNQEQEIIEQNQDKYNELQSNQMNINYKNQRQKTVFESMREAEIEKKKKYAEELKSQINEKNQEKFSKKLEQQIKPPPEESNDMNQAKFLQLEKQRLYREDLKNQIQQKNEQKLENEQENFYTNQPKLERKFEFQSPQNNQNPPLKPAKSYDNNYQEYSNNENIYSNNYNDQINPNNYNEPNNRNDYEMPSNNFKNNNNNFKKLSRGVSNQEIPQQGVAFVNKMEEEFKSRENKRKDMKLTYQEELKRQIDEKKKMKELENQKMKEEENREMQRLEKERLQMLEEEPPKPKGRKGLNAIIAQNIEKTETYEINAKQLPDLNQSKNEPYQNQLIKSENQENQKEVTPFFQNRGEPRKRGENQQRIENQPNYENQQKEENPPNYQSSQNQNEYPVAPQEYPIPPQRNIKHYPDQNPTYDEEFDKQEKALEEAIENKLLIDKLSQDEEKVLNEYKKKIKEINEVKRRYELECEKYKNLLGNYLSNQNHVDLVFLSKALKGEQESLIKEESQKVLKGMQSQLRESLQLTESLPTQSNLIYGDHNPLEQSFIKDLEVFKAMHWNYFLNESHFIEEALEKPNNPNDNLIINNGQITSFRKKIIKLPSNNNSPQKNPLKIPETKLGDNQENQENKDNFKFKIPENQPQSQRTTKTPKLFQSLLRSNTQEIQKVSQNQSDIDQKTVLSVEMKEEKPREIQKTQISLDKNHLQKLLEEESDAQSYFVNSNNLDARKLPTPMQKRILEEEDYYENEVFENDEPENIYNNYENENEIKMNDAKFNNEEKSLVLADEELDEAALEKLLESNEDKLGDIKPLSRAREVNNSTTNSKIGKFKKPKTLNVFGKIQNTNYDEKMEKESVPINRVDKALNKLDSYLSNVEKEDSKWDQSSIRKN